MVPGPNESLAETTARAWGSARRSFERNCSSVLLADHDSYRYEVLTFINVYIRVLFRKGKTQHGHGRMPPTTGGARSRRSLRSAARPTIESGWRSGRLAHAYTRHSC